MTGSWLPGTIRGRNDDGTFQIELDKKEMSFMPYWYGVTASEISFNDRSRWASIFAHLSAGSQFLQTANIQQAFASAGYQVPADKIPELWRVCCQKLFGSSEATAEKLALGEAESYRLFLHFGISAEECARHLQKMPRDPYMKLYWNQSRMGGRNPTDLGRTVSPEEMLVALGIADADIDQTRAAGLLQLEILHQVRLPTRLVDLLRRTGVEDAVTNCHPNNPTLLEFPEFEEPEWGLRRAMRQHNVDGDYAITFMVPHQGEHHWAAVFDEGDEDARVYLWWKSEEDEEWFITAPDTSMFFWDLAQTGAANWKSIRAGQEETKANPNRASRRKSWFGKLLRP